MTLHSESVRPSTSIERIDWSSIGRFSPAEILPLRHRLADEPLLSMESLRKLANRMYARKEVRFKPPQPTDLFISNDRHIDGWSIDEVFDRLEQPGSWMAIYHLTSDPEYADLCRSLLSEIDRHIGSIDPGLHGADLAIFLSSGPTETPYHIDQHPVFFFQLKGRKLMNLWDSRDPEVVPPQLAEEFLCERQEGLFRYQEAFQSRVMEFELAPGDGLYWPATTPHYVRTQSYWARPGDGVSLSFNISYYTKATRRRFCVSTLNRVLKQRTPIRPVPFGVSPLRDSLKYPFGRAYLLAHRLLKGQYLHPDQKL